MHKRVDTNLLLSPTLNTISTTASGNVVSSTSQCSYSAVENSRLPIYASAVSMNIKEAVKLAVDETMKRYEIEDQACVTIYGMPESGHDYTDVSKLFNKMKAKVHVVKILRVGKLSNSKSSGGKTFLRLRSEAEHNVFLAMAKGLKDDTKSQSIRIVLWLACSELDKVKILRQQCQQMNDQSTAIINGNKPYVVINGRLMIRSIDDKLGKVPSAQITVTSNETCNVDSSQSKNVNG